MRQQNQRSQKILGIVGAIYGSMLFGLPAMAQSDTPAPNPPATNGNSVDSSSRGSLRNPCPNIFYESKYKDTVGIPAGCPANSSVTPTDSSSATSSGSSLRNPCPSIFYESKYKDTVGLPAGCPATPAGTSSSPQQ